MGAPYIYDISRLRVNVCVCEGFVMCGCFDNNTLTEVFLNLTEGFPTLTEGFPCFFLSCKANARVKLTKTGNGPHTSTLVVICVVRLLFVLFYVLFVCKCVLYYCHRVTTQLQLINISYIVSYHIVSYHFISYHHIISYHRIISYHISYHIISYHIVSYHTILM